MNIDDVISLYVGKVTSDKKRIAVAPEYTVGVPRSTYQKELERDSIVLSALKCAKANGFTGEV